MTARSSIPVLLLTTMGCSGDSAPSSARQVSGAELGGPDVPLTAETEELFLLGGASAATEWEAFTAISEVHFDQNGNLLLLDRRQNRVVVVGPDGRFRHQVSRAGQGPGELRLAVGVAPLHSNRVLVRDVGHNALFLFDEGGRFLSQEVAIQEPPSRIEGQGIISSSQNVPILLDVFPDDRLLIARRLGDRALDIHTIGQGSREVYQAYTPPPAETGDGENVSIRVGDMEVPIPLGIIPRRTVFGPPLLGAVLADGGIAVVDSVGYQIKILRSDDGSVRTVLERAIQPLPVTEEMREAAREREGAGGGTRVIASGPGVSATDAEALSTTLTQSMVPEMAFASELPVISDLNVDHESRIWVSRSGDDGVSPGPVDVLTQSGGYLGTLSADEFQVPDAFGPNGLMAYVDLDEFEVPILRVVRLVSLTNR
ncbi:MAG: hypothetical protein F4Z31_09175 [Gemmatimonadetes bacterium]|nr:hypothetical protein [Gemmatimonadota bacterium]